MAKHQKGENRTRTIQNDVKMHVTVGRAKLRMTSRNARIPSTFLVLNRGPAPCPRDGEERSE